MNHSMWLISYAQELPKDIGLAKYDQNPLHEIYMELIKMGVNMGVACGKIWKF